MITGLVAALPAEIRCLTRQEIKLNSPFRINDVVIVIISGIGASHAEKAAERLLYEKIDALVSWGTAAGLVSSVQSGDLLLPETVLDAKGKKYSTANTWNNQIRSHFENTTIRIHDGLLVETSSMLESPQQKTALADATSAIAADMETAAVMRVAKRNNLPCSVIRTVVDEVHNSLPPEITRHTDIYGNPDIMGILDEMFFKPRLIPSMYHLATAMHAATGTLARIARVTGGLSLHTS